MSWRDVLSPGGLSAGDSSVVRLQSGQLSPSVDDLEALFDFESYRADIEEKIHDLKQKILDEAAGSYSLSFDIQGALSDYLNWLTDAVQLRLVGVSASFSVQASPFSATDGVHGHLYSVVATPRDPHAILEAIGAELHQLTFACSVIHLVRRLEAAIVDFRDGGFATLFNRLISLGAEVRELQSQIAAIPAVKEWRTPDQNALLNRLTEFRDRLAAEQRRIKSMIGEQGLKTVQAEKTLLKIQSGFEKFFAEGGWELDRSEALQSVLREHAVDPASDITRSLRAVLQKSRRKTVAVKSSPSRFVIENRGRLAAALGALCAAAGFGFWLQGERAQIDTVLAPPVSAPVFARPDPATSARQLRAQFEADRYRDSLELEGLLKSIAPERGPLYFRFSDPGSDGTFLEVAITPDDPFVSLLREHYGKAFRGITLYRSKNGRKEPPNVPGCDSLTLSSADFCDPDVQVILRVDIDPTSGKFPFPEATVTLPLPEKGRHACLKK